MFRFKSYKLTRGNKGCELSEFAEQCRQAIGDAYKALVQNIECDQAFQQVDQCVKAAGKRFKMIKDLQSVGLDDTLLA